MAESERSQPRVVVASGGEWAGRSLQAVLELKGYSVIRCSDGKRTLEIARHQQPAALIIDESLKDTSGLEIARALRDDPDFDHATPVIVIAQAPVAASIRAEALAAGAWEYYTHPLDTESLLLKLRTYVRAKCERESRPTLYVDRANCVFSREALLAWARQLGSRAKRERESLACVVVASRYTDRLSKDFRTESASIGHLAEVWLNEGRGSDVVAQLTPTRLAILTPGTDSKGAIRVVERLVSAMSDATASDGQSAAVLCAGYSAIDDPATSEVSAVDLLGQAERALDYAEATSNESAALSFDQLPH